MSVKAGKIVISAGELSGDEHGASLVDALRKFSPHTEVRAMGGNALRSAGAEIVVDYEEYGSVMGFFDVFKMLPRIMKSLSEMKRLLRTWKPDLLVLIDYPDFNLRLARYAKSLDIPVLYFIPPSVWAWRSGRVKTIQRSVDCAALIYPFERDFYEAMGYDRAVYVGHPLADFCAMHREQESRADFFHRIGLNADNPTLAVFPGSRDGEIARNLTPMLEALSVLKREHEDVQAIINVAHSIDLDSILERLPKGSGIVAVKEPPFQVLETCDAGLLKSGTSNLQGAFARLPFAMFYETSRTNVFIVKTFVKAKEYSIVNIIRSGTVTELIEEKTSPLYVARELEDLLFDPKRREVMKRNLNDVVKSLASCDANPAFDGCLSAAERTAKLALEIIAR